MKEQNTYECGTECTGECYWDINNNFKCPYSKPLMKKYELEKEG